MSSFDVLQLRIGTAQPYGPNGELSAIEKHPVAGPLAVNEFGFSGDQQGDARHHGGLDKAVHVYSSDHYSQWQREFPFLCDRFQAGAFGENLVVAGICEREICLGDIWQTGEVIFQVSQGRQPCWKLNVRFADRMMARRVQESGRTGWYFRVLTSGFVSLGKVKLIERPNPDWSLERVTDLLYRSTFDAPALQVFAALPGLPQSWQKLASRRLETRKTEDWTARLNTPEVGAG